MTRATVEAIEFPACAGMIRLQSVAAADRLRVPRMRGDDPYWLAY